MNDFTQKNIGMSLVGVVEMADICQIKLRDACLSPGPGVGAGVGVAMVALADDVAAPAVGCRVVCRGDLQHAEPVDTGDGWAFMLNATWAYVEPRDQLEGFLAEAVDILDAMLLRAATIREMFDETDAEHDRLSELVFRLAGAHVAAVATDDE